MELVVVDTNLMGELSPHGLRAEQLGRMRGVEHAVWGDCLHYAFPSVYNWANAHLIQAIADMESDEPSAGT